MPHVDFSAMGLDEYADEFLNWCLQYRDNLEWVKQIKVMEIDTGSGTLHFAKGRIEVIEKNIKNKR